MNGDLFIFKGMVTSPWRHASDLGMITCVVIGDVLNQGQNVLVVVTGDGLIHLFCLLSQTANAHKQESEAKLDHCISQESSETILPTYTQKVPANIYIALLADIDGDGQLEFVVAMTDRVVRSYRWRCTSGDAEAGGSGCLVAQHKWEMFSQIGSVDVNSDEFGRQYLMVSQPGGTYVSLINANGLGVNCCCNSGQYSTTMWNSAACLVYATFNNNIYLYHNILMPQLCSRNLLEVMEKEEGLCDLLSALQVDSSSPSELKQLYRWCLYGQHPQ
ncbi:PREDICTED: integrin-alpha FG-GAP repeat-containing protein 2-like [Priapulus caudatus]|uniref:Integrin-alpha FG-GAP repeat-containing protein 2-like n=1 Tax=Priapulus caudatus TaxID=37621 RepID=A0ABM1F1R4_PRICU|nr:PREDICTED: integrin-alpha FG-GAP repeat-containing protein 2-like [Priapulus caudatus]